MHRPNRRHFRYLVAAVLAVALAAGLVVVGGMSAVDWATASASQYEYPPNKVVICHRTKSTKRPYVTISVAQSAVPAHLRHGDSLGSCSRRLNGNVTSKRIAFTNFRGQRVKRIGRGVFTVVVFDRVRSQNFHLTGPRVNRKTSLRFSGIARWRITFRKGVYGYRSDANRALRGSFRVR